MLFSLFGVIDSDVKWNNSDLDSTGSLTVHLTKVQPSVGNFSPGLQIFTT